MRTIEDYRAGCLVLLGDASGRRYTNDMLDMGFREALGAYRAFCPRKETVSQTVSAVQGISVLLPPLPPGVEILTARVESGYWLPFGVYQTDQHLYLNCYDTEYMPAAGEKLKVELSVPHRIAGLDDAAQTTIPENHAYVVIKGAAAAAMRIRARSVTEVFGKRPEDRAALMDQADRMETEFRAELSRLQSGSRDPLPRGGFPI